MGCACGSVNKDKVVPEQNVKCNNSLVSNNKSNSSKKMSRQDSQKKDKFSTIPNNKAQNDNNEDDISDWSYEDESEPIQEEQKNKYKLADINSQKSEEIPNYYYPQNYSVKFVNDHLYSADDPVEDTFENLITEIEKTQVDDQDQKIVDMIHPKPLRNLVDYKSIKLPPLQIKECSKGFNYGSNYIFTANLSGNLKQWSISSGTLIEDWEKIHNGRIIDIKHAIYGNRLFTQDETGELFEWKIGPPSSFRKDWKILTGSIIKHFALTEEGVNLFICDDKVGLKQWDSRNRILIKDWGVIFEPLAYNPNKPQKISCISISHDEQHMFLSDCMGSIRQCNLKTGSFVKYYERASLWEITSIKISHNNKYFFTLDSLGILKQFSILEKKFVNDWSEYCETDQIGEFILTTDSKHLYTSDKTLGPEWIGGGLGNLKQFLIKDLSLVRDFGDITQGVYGMPMAVTKNGKFLFTCDNDARMKQWDIARKVLHIEWGIIDDKAISLLYIM